MKTIVTRIGKRFQETPEMTTNSQFSALIRHLCCPPFSPLVLLHWMKPFSPKLYVSGPFGNVFLDKTLHSQAKERDGEETDITSILEPGNKPFSLIRLIFNV